MNTLFRRGCCQVCGEPLLKLVGTQTRYSHYCSRACLAMMAGFEESVTLKFLLINLRCFGGEGFQTLEEQMQKAVEQLPVDERMLADLLITILEIQD
jgi:hypothetical protein